MRLASAGERAGAGVPERVLLAEVCDPAGDPALEGARTRKKSFLPKGVQRFQRRATGTAQFSPGMVNGEVIAGGTQLSMVSGASVNFVPEPGTLGLVGVGLLAFGKAIRRKAKNVLS